MEDLAKLLEPYGVTDLAAVHRMIAHAGQQSLVTPPRVPLVVAGHPVREG